MPAVVQRLPPAHIQRQLALLGRVADAVGVLQIVDFAVKFDPLTELVPRNQPAPPAAGNQLVAEPVPTSPLKSIGPSLAVNSTGK